MSADAPYFGIDFGTTNSSMAWFDPKTKQAQLLKNTEGEEKTPSLVYFGEDETLVGKPVQDKLEESEHYDEEEREDLNQRVVKGIKRDLLNPPVIPIPGRKPIRPVEVVTEILGKLKRDAESDHFQEEIDRVVITCPAVFDVQKREVLLEAAAMIGFSHVELLEEPTAAAMAFVRRGQKVGKSVLVYDLGAGTFDLSVVTRNGGDSFHVPMEPQGNPRCGGNDFDLALYRYCDEIAREKLGQPISLTADLDMHFLDQCRSRKENLSGTKESRFSSMVFSEDGSVKFFKHKVSRETFEGLIRDRIAGTVSETAKVWERARDQGYEVDTVVMIGGSSRVPLVKQLLEEALPVEPRGFTEKDYAVALGAAYHAYEVGIGGGDPSPAEYRRALEICWTDSKLTHSEVEWLENLKNQELELPPEVAANVEREVMGNVIEEVLKRQEQTGKDRYRKILELGWKDKKLEALRRIPSARLGMLLDNHELFCERDFADCPVSAAKRKALAKGVPWPIFAMAAQVAAATDLAPTAAAERLQTLAGDLGLSEVQALSVERSVLGRSVEDFFKREEEAARKASRDEYRKEVRKAYVDGKLVKAKVDQLSASKGRLSLSNRATADIERDVLGDTVAAVLVEQEEVGRLARKHKIAVSKVKGTGKVGRVTERDMNAYIQEQIRQKQEQIRQKQECQERERKKLVSELKSRLDEHGEQFVIECEKGARKIMDSDSEWQNNLGKCLDPALKAYAESVQEEARAEVAKLKLFGLMVPTFWRPKLSAEIQTQSSYGGSGHGGKIGGAVIGGVIGTLIGGPIGTVIGASLGGGAGAVGDSAEYDEAGSKEQSAANVREAASGLRPALKQEAEKYLAKVEKAVATKQKSVRD
jgi:molecular chaperone DnaK (HSP70)